MPSAVAEPTTIAVWRVALDDWSTLTPARLAWLDRAEHARAERFYGQSHAQRWRVAHVALREILADVTGQRPESLAFRETEHGKPELIGDSQLAFSLSRAVDVALIAVGGSAPLGVDIEHISDAPDLADIAALHFASEELAQIDKLDENERVQAFFRCWTRKEAVVKAIGTGIGYDLKSFAVSIDSIAPRMLRPPPVDGMEWTIAEVPVSGPYAAALAVHQRAAAFTVTDWKVE